MTSFFSPDYGAANAHISELMTERDDFLAASKAQALRISALENKNAALAEDLQTANEQLEVQGLISENRARRLEEQDEQLARMRQSVRLLWGLYQDMQMRCREQSETVKSGSELLESLSELLADPGARADSAER